MTCTNETETEIENLLKKSHGIRESEITDVLREVRKPEDYLRRMDREDKRYAAVKEAIRKYFLSVDEWKKEENIKNRQLKEDCRNVCPIGPSDPSVCKNCNIHKEMVSLEREELNEPKRREL